MIRMCMILNTVGSAIPPVFVFPGARFQDTTLFGAPPGRLGLLNCPQSGWMTGPWFVIVLEHAKRHIQCFEDHIFCSWTTMKAIALSLDAVL